MRIIGNTNIDFMGQRKLWLSISLVLVIAAISVLATVGIKQGVEFAGGAEVILHYVETPDLDDIRAELGDAGLPGVNVTTFGGTDGKEVVIRVALPEDAEAGTEDEGGADLARQVVLALQPEDVKTRLAEGKIDLHTADQATLARRLHEQGDLEVTEAEAVSEAISDVRREQSGVFDSMDEALSLPGVTDAARAFLEESAFVGPFSLRGQEIIAGAVSEEMRDKAYVAILGALAFMLVYIWIRFQLHYGLAAIFALVHDTAITLGAFALAGLEANLPVIAAFLTLVGYSVNDTIVVFDRIRENVKSRGTGKLAEVINLSVNQNLSRTLITSITTWGVVACMFFLGGPVIRPFAFVLIVGVIVGTYSSIYIASPILLFWHERFAKRAASREKSKEKTRAAASRA